MVCVIFVREFVHLTNHFFIATHLDHGFWESYIMDETIVNAREISLLAFLLELSYDEVLVLSFFFPVRVTVGSTFPDVVVVSR